MLLSILLSFVMITFASADEPILFLTPSCPTNFTDSPRLYLKADVPAYAVAKCKNGDKALGTHNQVDFGLGGTFLGVYIGGDCQFYKKHGVNTYTVDVEVGWGEFDSRVINHKDVRTISCAYDDYGTALSASETVAEWWLNPLEVQTMLGQPINSTFDLQIVDVLGRRLAPDSLSIGRKVRLRVVETTSRLVAFRVLSCTAKNEYFTYPIVRAGCGDGLVFPKDEGFLTIGAEIWSPYFDAFKLQGSSQISFECSFTECTTNCDGDSCVVDARRRRRDLRLYSILRTIEME